MWPRLNAEELLHDLFGSPPLLALAAKGVLSPAERLMGTVHLFEAVRRLNTPCVVVNVTSDKCYAHPASQQEVSFGKTTPWEAMTPIRTPRGAPSS